jgi:hypothetical protein
LVPDGFEFRSEGFVVFEVSGDILDDADPFFQSVEVRVNHPIEIG